MPEFMSNRIFILLMILNKFNQCVPLLPFLTGDSAFVGDRAADLLCARLPSLDAGREPFFPPEPNHKYQPQLQHNT